MKRHRALAFGVLCRAHILGVGWACNGGVSVVSAPSCKTDKDCDNPLVCVSGHCHLVCRQSRDCSAGQVCVPSPSGQGVCEPLPAGAGTAGGKDASPGAGTGGGNLASPGDAAAADVTSEHAVDCARQVSSDVADAQDCVCAGYQVCGGICIDTQTDANNCGRCATVCTISCAQGQCTHPTAIAAGGHHTCALLSDGTVRCWGTNTSGELGDGTTSNASTPVAVLGLSSATAVAAGAAHSCALLQPNGQIRCWGTNESGQLGNANFANRVIILCSPRRMLCPPLTGATAIVAGDRHTCALLSGGSVQCWGYNADGELGNGTTMSSAVSEAVSGLSGATAIEAGFLNTCALLSGGTVECWGSAVGLGTGTATNSLTAVAVPNVMGAIALSIGGYPCAVLSGGMVECWPNTSGSSTPTTVPNLSSATGVAGWYHACALLSGGGVQCWGRNESGQLGNGTTADSSTPVVVSTLPPAIGVAAGYMHSCALLSDRRVQCWGYNSDGELGNATTVASSTPVTVEW
jgi:alpha-tubulin suppressor-like RCC1 family protein